MHLSLANIALLLVAGILLELRLVHPATNEIGTGALAKAAALQFAIAVYGGFYGAGAGILELAVLDMLGLDNIHLANAFKMILTTAFNALAVLIFVAVGKIFWPAGLITAAATIIGGYGGLRSPNDSRQSGFGFL